MIVFLDKFACLISFTSFHYFLDTTIQCQTDSIRCRWRSGSVRFDLASNDQKFYWNAIIYDFLKFLLIIWMIDEHLYLKINSKLIGNSILESFVGEKVELRLSVESKHPWTYPNSQLNIVQRFNKFWRIWHRLKITFYVEFSIKVS